MNDKMELLKLSGVSVGYGAIRVVKSLSMRVAQGEVVAVLGANGAGKSTLLRTISGLLKPAEGEVLWHGQPIQGMPPHEIARLGIVHVPEGRGIFPELTVAENLQMGSFALAEKGQGQRPNVSMEEIWKLFPDLAPRRAQRGGTLSGGQQQMLAIARGLLAQPLLLILDEPTLGLSPLLGQEVLAKLREIVKLGVSVLLVEQDAGAAMAAANRVYVMSGGQIVTEGTAEAVASNQEVHQAYLGGVGSDVEKAIEPASIPRQDATGTATMALGVEGLSISFGGNKALDSVTLEVREGEIVGLIGPNGAGKSTLINCVAGILTPSVGTIRLFGQDLKGMASHKRCHIGLTRTFQNLQLFSTMTVRENVTVAVEVGGGPALRAADGQSVGGCSKEEQIDRLLKLFDLEDMAFSITASLPYGVRKLIELARVVGAEGKMLLLDEPAAGLNTAEKDHLAGILRRTIAERRLSVLLVEHDMGMVQALAERVYVLDAGRGIAQGTFSEVANDPEVIRAYLGEAWSKTPAAPV